MTSRASEKGGGLSRAPSTQKVFARCHLLSSWHPLLPVEALGRVTPGLRKSWARVHHRIWKLFLRASAQARKDPYLRKPEIRIQSSN